MKYDLTLSRDQVEFLQLRFDMKDPNDAIEFLIEMMAMEMVSLEPNNIKRYIMKMMEEELRQCS